MITWLNIQRNAYYNLNSTNVSDREFDVKYEELELLEKVRLETPLLSLDKAKQTEQLFHFIGNRDALMVLPQISVLHIA